MNSRQLFLSMMFTKPASIIRNKATRGLDVTVTYLHNKGMVVTLHISEQSPPFKKPEVGMALT